MHSRMVLVVTAITEEEHDEKKTALLDVRCEIDQEQREAVEEAFRLDNVTLRQNKQLGR